MAFSEDHGGSASKNPPTNATATPRIVNLAVLDVDLTVLGPSLIDTLAEVRHIILGTSRISHDQLHIVTRAVHHALLRAHADWVLIGAWNPMV